MAFGAAGALAGTASVSGSQLTYTASPGEVNDVTVTSSPAGQVIAERSVTITAGAGCTSSNARTVTCTGPITSVSINVGDGNDAVRNGAALASTIFGGDGDDTLIGSSRAIDRINGEGGNDFIDPDVGEDAVDGGAGDDTIAARGAHRDSIVCGLGLT